MANVTFALGSSAPGSSGLTTGRLYCSTNGGIWYASSATATNRLADKVECSSSTTTYGKVNLHINTSGGDSNGGESFTLSSIPQSGCYITTGASWSNYKTTMSAAASAGASVVWVDFDWNTSGTTSVVTSGGASGLHGSMMLYRMSNPNGQYIGTATIINAITIHYLTLYYDGSNWELSNIYNFMDSQIAYSNKSDYVDSSSSSYSYLVSGITVRNFSKY